MRVRVRVGTGVGAVRLDAGGGADIMVGTPHHDLLARTRICAIPLWLGRTSLCFVLAHDHT